jgi:peptide/nickel transport system substrate-binding protein
MKRTKKLLTLLSLLLTMLMLLAACGGGSTPAASDADTPAASNVPDAAVQPAASGEEVVIRRCGTYENATSWDPVDNPGAASTGLATQIFETLIYMDIDLNIHPLLAESWDVSPDYSEYTFHLRKGVQFHGGYGEMTSEDVKFSFERFGNPEYESVYTTQLTLDNITAIETPDDYTVVFKLAIPDIDFLQRYTVAPTYVTSKKAFDDIGREGFIKRPIGTGAFAYDKGTLGIQSEAVAFDDYWNGRPKIDRVTFIVMTDANAVYSAFENNEIDLVELYYLDKVNEYKAQG